MTPSSPNAPPAAGQAAALALRPLTIGEILDRAVNLYFKNVVTFTALLVVVMVPIILVQYLATKDTLDAYLSVMEHALRSPATPQPADPTKILEAASHSQVWTGVSYLLLFFALPLANAAVVIAVSRAYLGMPIRFADCYRNALGRWLTLVLLSILWLFVLVAAFFAVFVFFALFIGASAALGALVASSGARTAGAIAVAVVAIAMALLAIGVGISMYMTYACSFIAAVLERADPVHAFASAFGRVFGGGQFGRSVVLSLALFAISLGGGLLVTAVGGLLFFFSKSVAPYFLVAALGNLFLIAFGYVVVAVYYYDIRIRREGLDLQLLAEQIAGGERTPA